MPLYVISFMDKPGMAETRLATRPAHLAYLAAHGEAYKMGGPFLDAEGRSIGSLLVVEAKDEAAARALADNDPYKAAGLLDEWKVQAWTHTYGQLP